MRSTLSLAIFGDHLSLCASAPGRQRSWKAVLHTLLGKGKPRGLAMNAPSAEAQLSTEYLTGGLIETLEQTWATLRAKHPRALTKVDLRVQLGLAHARLGLLPLPEEGGTSLKQDAVDRYVQAWISQMWGVDPAGQITRWERTESNEQVLVSCIDRAVFEDLASFARRHRLRFVSCKPAALNALDSVSLPPQEPSTAARKAAESVTVVWSEPSGSGGRAALVQLMHRVGSQPQALWRGWVPASASNSAQDAPLLGALRRFMGARKLAATTRVEWVRWTPDADSPGKSGASA